MEIKFLLDENVDPRLRKALQQRNPEIVAWAVAIQAPQIAGSRILKSSAGARPTASSY